MRDFDILFIKHFVLLVLAQFLTIDNKILPNGTFKSQVLNHAKAVSSEYESNYI